MNIIIINITLFEYIINGCSQVAEYFHKMTNLQKAPTLKMTNMLNAATHRMTSSQNAQFSKFAELQNAPTRRQTPKICSHKAALYLNVQLKLIDEGIIIFNNVGRVFSGS